jgi:hypothetical protein
MAGAEFRLCRRNHANQSQAAPPVLPLRDMSGINGDKARFNRVRKNKLALRERSQAIRKEMAAAAAAKTPEAKPASEPAPEAASHS